METASQNATAVVTAWRCRTHVDVWEEPAVSAKPSEINDNTAAAWAAVELVANAQADALEDFGFLSGHSTVRELRGVAKDAARRSKRLGAWADDLRAAEAVSPSMPSTPTPPEPPQ